MSMRLAIFLAMLQSAAAWAADTSAFEQDTQEVRRICMDRLCLGMTIQEVQAITPPLKWHSSPNGKVTCNKHETVGAKFVDIRGETFNLGFALVKTVGLAADRYRLSNIAAHLTDVSKQDMQKRLLVLSGKNNIPVSFGTDFGSRNTDSGRFLVVTSAMSLGENEGGGYSLLLASLYNGEEAWLKTLPVCRGYIAAP